MFGKERASDDLIRIEEFEQLASLLEPEVVGRKQASEEEQAKQLFQ